MNLQPNERIDDLGRRGYRIIQNTEKFCFGVDAALLAWFAEAKTDERVMDLGSGTGIVPILMDARYAAGEYTGLEIQEDMVEMAGRSAMLNGISEHVRFVQGDIKTASQEFGKASFDVVTANPPYMPAGSGLPNPDSAKNIARHEVLCTLDDVVREAALLLKPGGRFYMVHRPARIPGIFERMRENKLAPSRMILVHPFRDREAAMVLISGRKGGHDMLKAEPPVVIYETPGEYTEEVKRIYHE